MVTDIFCKVAGGKWKLIFFVIPNMFKFQSHVVSFCSHVLNLFKWFSMV